MSLGCGCRTCRSRPVPADDWVSDAEYKAWKSLRWTYQRDIAAHLEGPRSVRRESAFRGLATLIGDGRGVCRRPEHAALPKHGSRH